MPARVALILKFRSGSCFVLVLPTSDCSRSDHIRSLPTHQPLCHSLARALERCLLSELSVSQIFKGRTDLDFVFLSPVGISPLGLTVMGLGLIKLNFLSRLVKPRGQVPIPSVKSLEKLDSVLTK